MSGNKKHKSSFFQLLKNIIYLTKLNLKKTIIKNKLIEFSYEEILENMLYFVHNSSISRPKIYDADKTAIEIKMSDKSLARFGDGELEIINGNNILFQEYDEKLANRLKEILRNNQDELLVGIPYGYFYPKFDPNENQFYKDFNLYRVPQYRHSFLQHIDLEKQYVDTGFTGGGIEQTLYDYIRTIWQDKKIITVGCQEADKAVHYDVYDNSAERIKIFTPNKHAFREYERILNDIKKYDSSYLVILMCGPTAKVLAADLSKLGYRALDLGHLAKGYDYFMRKIPLTSETANKFFLPDEDEN